MCYRIIFIVLFVSYLSDLACGKPFLYNAPGALVSLASSASASASSPSEPITHIANLRNKQRKAEKLQAEKQLVDEGDGSILPAEEEDKNEVAPSLLQKKINKILTKIRLISSFSSTSDDNNGNKDEHSVETSSNNDTTSSGGDAVQKEPEEIENDVLNEKNSTEYVFQKVIYPDSRHGVPIKLRFNINEKQIDASDIDGENEVMMSRLSQFGVFIAELLGSVVALVYGAAAQLNNVVQGTTASSQI